MRFNPFVHLIETNKDASTRLKRSDIWRRVKDTFRVFYGSLLLPTQIGLLDYLNPFARVFEVISFMSFYSRSPLSKGVFAIAIVPTALLNAIKFLAAAVLTFASLPFVAFTHWFFKSERAKLAQDIKKTKISPTKKFVEGATKLELKKSDLSIGACVLLATTSSLPKNALFDRIKESAVYIYAYNSNNDNVDFYYAERGVRKLLFVQKLVQEWTWTKIDLSHEKLMELKNFYKRIKMEGLDLENDGVLLSETESKLITSITGHRRNMSVKLDNLIETFFDDYDINPKSLMLTPLRLSADRNSFHFVQKPVEGKSSAQNPHQEANANLDSQSSQQGQIALGLVKRCPRYPNSEPDYDDADRYNGDYSGQVLGVIKVKPENYTGINALLKTNTFWATEMLEKAGVLEEVEAQINEDHCRRECK